MIATRYGCSNTPSMADLAAGTSASSSRGMASAKPLFSSASLWKAVSARSDVKVSLSAKLTETASGATMWTDSAWMTTNVANASFNDHGSGTFGASDPNAAYGPMIDQLSCEITDDFRTHYVTKRVPKDDVQTASAGD